MIATTLLELPLSRTYFHGSKGVQAIEVLLYLKSAIPRKKYKLLIDIMICKYGIKLQKRNATLYLRRESKSVFASCSSERPLSARINIFIIL